MRTKLNYFAADKGKSLISRFFIKAETIFLWVYGVFHTVYFQMIFYTFLNVIYYVSNSLLWKSSSVRCKSDVI